MQLEMYIKFTSKIMICMGNYFYRATHNLVKGLGKVKGTLRWLYYKNILSEILEKFSPLLKTNEEALQVNLAKA